MLEMVHYTISMKRVIYGAILSASRGSRGVL